MEFDRYHLARTNCSILSLTATLLVCTFPILLYAQSISILDCNGFTRATKQATASQPNDVEVKITDSEGMPANGTNVTLTNTITGQSVTAPVVGGAAHFTGLAPGVFSLSVPAGSNAVLGAVSFNTAAFTGGIALGGAALGAGATAGVVEGGVRINDSISPSNSNDSDAPPPLPTPKPTPIPKPTNCPCDPDEVAPGINDGDFFDKRAETSTILSPSY